MTAPLSDHGMTGDLWAAARADLAGRSGTLSRMDYGDVIDDLIAQAGADGHISTQEQALLETLSDQNNMQRIMEALHTDTPMESVAALTFTHSDADAADVLVRANDEARGHNGASVGAAGASAIEWGTATGDVDITSAAGRRSVLNRYTQAIAGDGDNHCGAACVVAAAIHSGTADFTRLVNLVAASPSNPVSRDPALQERLHSGHFSMQDLASLQGALYDTLTAIENDGNPYLQESTIQNWLNQHNLASMFGNDCMMRCIDSSGDGIENHYVLDMAMPEGDRVIFDPWPRADSSPDDPHQLVDGAAAEVYRGATEHVTMGQTGGTTRAANPFAATERG